jgi:hypothetical protein
MKLHHLTASVCIAGSLLVAGNAKALQITTGFVQFSNTNLNTQTRNPPTLTFDTFNKIYSGPGVLKSVGFKLANNSNGTGEATTTQKLAFLGALGDSGSYGTVNQISYRLALAFADSFAINGNWGSTTSTTPSVPGVTDAGLNTIYTLNGGYSGTSVFTGNLTGPQLTAFTTGTSVTTLNTAAGYSVEWGRQSDYTLACYGPSDPNYDPACSDPGGYSWGSAGISGTAGNRAKLNGWIALVYDYEVPPSSTAPGPVPLVGAAAAFGWSRRLKKRVTSAA